MNSYAELKERLGRSEIPALDGLRAIAVLLVIFYHFGFSFSPAGQGVTVFFVLSGFLITWLLLKENEKTGTISLGNFYWRRTLRIFPAFYVYWCVCVAFLLVRHLPIPWGHAWSAFFYVSNYYSALNSHPENLFSHTWSLGIEEQFYLLFPALFLFWRNNLARLTAIIIGVIGAIWVWRAVLVYVFEASTSFIYAAFDTRFDNLLVGCLFAVLLKRDAHAALFNAVTKHAALPLIPLVLVLLSIYVAPQFVPRWRDVFGFAFEPFLFAILIVQCVRLSDTRALSWLEWNWMKYLGRISYPLYLYQQIALHPAKKLLAAFPVGVQLIGALVVTIFIASLSYYFVERPFLKLKDRMMRRRREKSFAVKAAPIRTPRTDPQF